MIYLGGGASLNLLFCRSFSCLYIHVFIYMLHASSARYFFITYECQIIWKRHLGEQGVIFIWWLDLSKVLSFQAKDSGGAGAAGAPESEEIWEYHCFSSFDNLIVWGSSYIIWYNCSYIICYTYIILYYMRLHFSCSSWGCCCRNQEAGTPSCPGRGLGCSWFQPLSGWCWTL